MRRSRYFGAALAGLLVVAAISVAAGSGRKPAKEVQSAVSVRPISGSEMMDILHKFPEMIPDCFASMKNDTSALASLFSLSEVTAAPLERAFPTVRFYEGRQLLITPDHSYLMAIAGSRRLMMPGEFNHLLLPCGLKVTDENVIELAEAFVLLAVGEWADGVLSYPQIDFLEAKKSKLKPDVLTYDAAVLKVRVGEHIERWRFDVLHNQFDAAGSKNEEGRRMDYTPSIVDSLPGQGRLNPSPDMVIDTSQGQAHVEHEGQNAHYYVIADSNSTATQNKVFFSLTGFPRCSTNVYLRVMDSVRHDTVWRFKNVTIDSTGSGSDTWMPPVSSTGICFARAGYLIGDTFSPVTARRELTPERVRDTIFPGTSTGLRVYFCDQFFTSHPMKDTHAATFAQYVTNATLESWQTQVST
jgi:hypothetical protein